jgi:hypothetical protein
MAQFINRRKQPIRQPPRLPIYPRITSFGPICFSPIFAYSSDVEHKVFDMERDELIRRLKILIITVAMYVAMC